MTRLVQPIYVALIVVLGLIIAALTSTVAALSVAHQFVPFLHCSRQRHFGPSSVSDCENFQAVLWTLFRAIT